jgi:hypothetical protein
MIEISREALELASPEERDQIVEKILVIKKEPHTGPVLTIHPKVRKKGSVGEYETRCILNKVALQSIFSQEAEKYELDFGNRTWIHMPWDEETGEYSIQKISILALKVAEGEPQKGKSMARLKISATTGLIENDWLARAIFQLDKTLGNMDKNTKYHFLLMPCETSSKEMEEGIKTGWEMNLLKEEPAEELVLVTDVTQN